MLHHDTNKLLFPGCDVKCFPPPVLEKWKFGELHHNKAPNSAHDSIEQMKAFYRLLTILGNCLARAADYYQDHQNEVWLYPSLYLFIELEDYSVSFYPIHLQWNIII